MEKLICVRTFNHAPFFNFKVKVIQLYFLIKGILMGRGKGMKLLFGLVFILFFIQGGIHASNVYGSFLTKTCSIAEAKVDKNKDFIPDRLGDTVTITGRATVSSGVLWKEKKLIIYLQDSTGGIAIYKPVYNGPAIKVGDSLKITGVVNQYLGLTELDDPHITFVDTLHRKIPKPAPLINHNLESYEGRLVTLKARVIGKRYNNGGRYLIISLAGGSDSTFIVFKSKYSENPDLLNKYSIGELLQITGIFSQHDYGKKRNGHYQILPRTENDLIIIEHTTSFYLIIIGGITSLVFLSLLFNILLKRKVNRHTRALQTSKQQLSTINRQLEIINRELKISIERYKTLITVSNTGAWEYHADTGFMWCSPEYFSMLGRDVKDYAFTGAANLKETWIDLLHPDDRERANTYFSNYIKAGSLGMYENYFRMKHSNGRWIWILSRGNTIRDENGEITNLTVGTHIDITKQKLAEEKLKKALEKAKESDRLKSAFLANISHEIRTPMNGIIGFINLLNNADLSETERKEYTAIINKSGDRLLNTINDLIDISKIEAGQIEISKSEVSINDLLIELQRFFTLEANSKGLSIISSPSLSQKEATIITDENKLHQILTNLIKNAIKFTEKGNISFGYTLKDSFIEFYIKDTGIGIPKDRQQAVFNRFIQADIGTGYSRSFEGSGLGLSIAKAYVEMLGGRIWLSSEKGTGTTFRFTIPYKKG